MKVYITYDRYERDEWFNIYYITTDREEAIKHCKEEDLPNFISYGPDDGHSFQLQVVEMTQEEYEQLKSWVDDDSQSLDNLGTESSEFFKKMVEIFNETHSYSSTLLSTDGCTDNVDIIHFYGRENLLNTEDDEVFYEVQEKLFDDEELYKKVLKDYINDNYDIN